MVASTDVYNQGSKRYQLQRSFTAKKTLEAAETYIKTLSTTLVSLFPGLVRFVISSVDFQSEKLKTKVFSDASRRIGGKASAASSRMRDKPINCRPKNHRKK